jgi:WD40 repeat protein
MASDGQVLMSLAQDGEVRFWDIITYAQLQIIKPAHVMEAIASVRFNPHHQALVTTTNRLGLWQHPRKVATDEVLHATLLAPSGHRHPLVSVLYSFQFYLVVSGDESGTICVWDVRTGVQVFRFELGSGLASMALDSSGRKLLTGAVDGTVTLWNFSSGQRLKVVTTPKMHALEVSGLAHVQLAKLAYFVSVGWQSNGVADVWMWPDREKSESMNQPRRLPGHTDDILSVAFCLPNYLCTGAYDGVVLVHNCESAALHRRVQISTPPPGSQRAKAAALAGGFGQRVEKPDPQKRAGEPQDLLAAVLGGVGSGSGSGSGSGEEAPVTSTLLRSVAIEALDVLDAARRVLPDAVLVAGAADGYLRLWSVRAMTLLGELRVCLSESDGLLSVCTEPSATLLLCSDSAGRIYIYDVSDMASIWDAWTARGAPVPASGAPALDTAAAVQPLYTWRAHTHAITQLAYLTGVEGVLSASVDCTVRLWTLSGEQVGVFGQGAPWVFEARSSWFDAKCHALDGADHDRVRASEERLEGLLPQAQAARAKQPLDASQRGSKGGKKASVYRLPTETLSALSHSISQLGIQTGGAKGGGIAGATKALSGGSAGMGESNYAVTNKLTAGLRQPLKPHEPIPMQERSAVLAAALVGEGADAVAPTGLSYQNLTKGTLWSNPAVPGMGLGVSASAPGGLTRPGTAEPPLSASLSWLSTAGNKRPARLNTPTPFTGSKPRPAKLAPL